MRNLSALLIAILLAGCSRSTQPVNFTGPAVQTAALDCVRTQLSTHGYRVDPGSPAGTVTGVRINEVPWLLKLIGFQDTANQITATTSGGQLQVTALSSDPGDPGQGGGSVTGVGANRQTEEDARQVFAACSDD